MIVLPLWTMNAVGWLAAHWRWIVYPLAVIAIIALGMCGYRAWKPQPKLNEKEIQAGEQAVKERNDKELKEILATADAREAEIDANVSNAEAQTEKAKEEAKKKYEGMTVDELAAELEKRK